MVRESHKKVKSHSLNMAGTLPTLIWRSFGETPMFSSARRGSVVGGLKCNNNSAKYSPRPYLSSRHNITSLRILFFPPYSIYDTPT